MTTIRELLETSPLRIDKGVSLLINSHYSHLPELDGEELTEYLEIDTFCEDVEVHVFYDQLWDLRRSQKMFSVKFKDVWVMLCFNAGRLGGDYSRRQILDKDAYNALLTYIKLEMITHTPESEIIEVDLDSNVQFVFYGDHDVRYNTYRAEW